MAEQDDAPGGAVAGAKPAASVDLVAQALGAAREAGGACFVLGAGVSASAGVPSSAELLARAQERFPEGLRHARRAAGEGADLSPHLALAHLSLGERARLIGDALRAARLNWEHLVLAEFMSLGHVGPVFTMNFDTLLEDACGRAGVAPMVYDLSAGVVPAPWAVAGGPAIFHLNGIRDRVTAWTDDAERIRARFRIEPLVRHVLYRGVPIVVLGHRGVASPLVELLAEHDRFANRLFWVAHFDHPLSLPARALVEKAGNDALLLERYDAEGFLVALARKLGAFPPRFVANPYAAMLRAWESISLPADAEAAAPFEAAVANLGRSAAEIDARKTVRAQPEARRKTAEAGPAEETPRESAAPLRISIEEEPIEPVPAAAPEPTPAPKRAEEPPAPAEILADLARERYQRAIRGGAPETPQPAPAATRRDDEARAERGGAATPARLRLVVGDYRKLVEDFEAGRLDELEDASVITWAYVMLGNEDARRALAAFGPEAEALWKAATGNYAAAIRIDPRHADALYNWASAAASRARTLSGAAAERLWTEAVVHFEQMLELRPDDTEALADCARALVGRARTMSAPRSEELIDRALDLLAHAYRLGDDMAYVGYVVFALAHARHRKLLDFVDDRPKDLPDAGHFALALADLIAALERKAAVDLAPFDELPDRDDAPCRDWDFAEIEPALMRLSQGDGGFVRGLIDILQGARPLGDWRALRDSWIAGNPERTPVSRAGSL